MNTRYKFGRDNIALTIFVPNDCDKNCHFCTTKQEYKEVNKSLIESNIKLFAYNNESIKEVVFTGGEPLKSIGFMEDTINLIKEYNQDIKFYVNTEFNTKGIVEFAEFLIFCSKYIDGVSISRHHHYLRDNDITCINMLSESTNVRLNHIEGLRDKDFIFNCEEDGLKREVAINIRADYRLVTREDLHTKEHEFLKESSELEQHTKCNVCDTKTYDFDGRKVSYHRGLTTSTIIHKDGTKEVNDIIIKPNGNIYLDWNNEPEKVSDILEVIQSPIDLDLQKFTCGGGVSRC